MKDKLIQIFTKFNYEYYKLNFTNSLDSIIEQVYNEVLDRSYYREIDRMLISALFQLKRKEQIQQLYHDPGYSCFIKEILEDSYYTLVNDFIVCKKLLTCNAIRVDSSFYILSDSKISKISKMGFYITEYRIGISKTVKNIYCCGKHPNVDKHTGSFCLGSSLAELPLNKENLEIVEEMLTQFNLDSTFMSVKQRASILEVIESEEKENQY